MSNRSSCKFPDHHDVVRSAGSGLLMVAVVLAGLVVLAAVRFVTAYLWWFIIPAVLAVVLRLGLAVVRFARLDRTGKRHWFLCRWHRLGWKRLARNLQLALPDRHRGGIDSGLPKKVNYPRRVRFRPDAFGWTVAFRPPPGVTREDVEKQAESLADRWRCARVGVSKPAPGRFVLRACRRDPLAEPVPAGILPSWDGRHLVLGRDELGSVRRIDLANLSGSCIGGNPGRGKTESASGMAVQLVPDPRVELHVLDGGGCDWAPLAPVATAYCDDNLADAEELLLELHAQMMTRRRNLQADTGFRNAWKCGPSPAYPLRWLLIEEASAFFDLDAVKGDRDRERRVRACRGLAAQLLRRGRAPMHHTTMVCQKPTGAGGLPPELRDLAGLRWCFGVATTETAVAALGDDIRRYETASPTLLQGPEHVGVATALLATGLDPFTRLKFPEVGEARIDAMAEQVLRSRLPDDARELVG